MWILIILMLATGARWEIPGYHSWDECMHALHVAQLSGKLTGKDNFTGECIKGD